MAFFVVGAPDETVVERAASWSFDANSIHSSVTVEDFWRVRFRMLSEACTTDDLICFDGNSSIFLAA